MTGRHQAHKRANRRGFLTRGPRPRKSVGMPRAPTTGSGGVSFRRATSALVAACACMVAKGWVVQPVTRADRMDTNLQVGHSAFPTWVTRSLYLRLSNIVFTLQAQAVHRGNAPLGGGDTKATRQQAVLSQAFTLGAPFVLPGLLTSMPASAATQGTRCPMLLPRCTRVLELTSAVGCGVL